MTLSSDLKKINTIKKHLNISKYKGIGSIQKIDGKIYFQSKNHFYRYSIEQNIFFEDKKWSKVFSKIAPITSLKQDLYGNLWYTYSESIGMLKKEKNGTYSKNEAPLTNLNGNLVNKFVSINTVDSSNIFIGLTDGMAHYDSEIQYNYSSKPNAFIESFSFATDTIFKANLNFTSKITSLPYNSNNVKFKFTSTPYENNENVKYAYKLVPFEDNWSNWSTSTIKEYTNLREGIYTMKVKTKNNYGVVSNNAEMHFAICAPWYRSPIAYIVYVLLLLFCFYIIYLRVKIKIRKNKYYETIEQRRIYLEKETRIRNEQYELEKEIVRLKNDKLKTKLLSKDKELVNNSLQVVKKNKILNGIISKLKYIDSAKLDEATKFEFNKLQKSIAKEVNSDKSWKDLEKHLKNVHFDFLKKLKEKHPTISPREMDLSTYLLMNMSTKEIAEFMNISTAGVELARYRLRKKIGLNQKENLIGYLMSI
jgi:DNA-binding CsgD family transcriptional regulator